MSFQIPIVSFVVPCYKLADFLPECINSILSQSFSSLEVLIMDDCSPDHTSDVARSFSDPRINYIRNDHNLGALRNYNKGIQLCRGKYIWLISADDYLRRPYILERYVKLMETHQTVGYSFCPGYRVSDGQETGLLQGSTYGRRNRVVSGHKFLKRVLDCCFILSPSVLARRECYEAISMFPLDVTWAGEPVDLIWGGDWYLWCMFALHYDVAYFAEPMVCYREHDQSYTTLVTSESTLNCVRADIAVPWMIKKCADDKGMHDVTRICLKAIAKEYARHLSGKLYRSATSTITLQDFKESLKANIGTEAEKVWIGDHALSIFYTNKADTHYEREDFQTARALYSIALRHDPHYARAKLKLTLLSLGKVGDYIRQFLVFIRHRRERRKQR
ncbi:Glycosyltransferase, family 2 [Cyanobium sp. Copco_Reservoir_LC18]|nr:Glycosyltransferase, family 2 [Cyanobium sp. Copco_Reservoir_LC18]